MPRVNFVHFSGLVDPRLSGLQSLLEGCQYPKELVMKDLMSYKAERKIHFVIKHVKFFDILKDYTF